MLEIMFPQANKIELFARNERINWDCWGSKKKTKKYCRPRYYTVCDCVDINILHNPFYRHYSKARTNES